MKARKRNVLIMVGLIFVLTLVAILTAKLEKETKAPEEIASGFLVMLFSEEYYYDPAANDAVFRRFEDRVRKNFKEYCTNDQVEDLLNSRLVSLYAKLLRQAGAHISLSSIDFKQTEVDNPQELTILGFVVHLNITYDDNREPREIEQQGILNLTWADDQWKINAVRIISNKFDI